MQTLDAGPSWGNNICGGCQSRRRVWHGRIEGEVISSRVTDPANTRNRRRTAHGVGLCWVCWIKEGTLGAARGSKEMVKKGHFWTGLLGMLEAGLAVTSLVLVGKKGPLKTDGRGDEAERVIAAILVSC